jgi:hypothetical protein
MGKFEESLARVAAGVWETHQYAKVEFHRLEDLFKKKVNNTPSNKALMDAIEAIYTSTGELYTVLKTFEEANK